MGITIHVKKQTGIKTGGNNISDEIDMETEFKNYLNVIFEAAGAHARTFDLINSKERENIFFSIGWVRSHLIHNGFPNLERGV